MHVRVAPDPTSLADFAASLIGRLVATAPGARTSIGLAGGSTPGATYHQLRQVPVDWERTDLWLSDERWVAPDHSDSNGTMVTDGLGPVISERLHRPRWSSNITPDDAAAFYEATLRRLMPDGIADVVVLGMGSDGHTASLFPGTAALDAEDRWFVANEVPQLGMWRLTATAPMLQRARSLVVLVTGGQKAATLQQALEGPDDVYPVQLTRQAAGQVWWLVDQAAASRLERTAFEPID